jgi:uncharacterized protein (DUF885 family)
MRCLLLLTLCVLLLSGCGRIEELLGIGGSKTPDDAVPPIDTLSDAERFDLLMDELFEEWVSQDTLTMNYFLAYPEYMHIDRPDPTFGEVVTPQSIEREREKTAQLMEALRSYDYGLLRDDQQIIYDIINRVLELSVILERDEDFAYYTGYIRPLNGLQVQLPILLAEFTFYTEADIELYLQLLGDTTRYFEDIIEFERERSARGFFMNEANSDSVIEQLESYLQHREDNLLIVIFEDKIDEYAGLSDQQRESFKQRNHQLVLENVLPAYDILLDAMQELRGVGAFAEGLAALPNGEEFAHALLSLRTGTDRSPQELETLFSEWLQNIWMDIMKTLGSNPEIYDRLVNGTAGQIEEGTPESYMDKLLEHTKNDFPLIRPTSHVILEVHESLQEHMSPAFFLTPAIDNFANNVIYLNPTKIDDDLFFYTVLAHEGYPGHMYQTVYFFQQSPHPVRVQFSNSGYTEGWATYVEMLSYSYTDLDAEEATLIWNLRFYDLLLQSFVDLGVNVLGWDFEDVVQLFSNVNITDRTVISNVYNMVLGVPLHSLLYTIGYIEVYELLEEAMDTLLDDFDLVEFHRFLLDIGPTPFSLIRTHMEAWMQGCDGSVHT